MNLSLPRNGRVVVIDDKIEEGLPLINALSKNGIPTTYFSGKLKELPETPLEDVRIVFLDIVLETEAQSDKTKVSTVIGVLRKIVSTENGPYILIIWSKHNELVEAIKKKLNWNQPVLTLNLEKGKCKGEEDGFDLKMIEDKLESEFGNAGIFQLFLLWENIAHQSSGRLINEFKSFYAYGNDWNKNLTDVFSHLADAYAGAQLDKTRKEEIVKNGLLTLNGAFIDTFENAIRQSKYSDLNIEFNDSNCINEDICAKVNSKLLLINQLTDCSNQPGNVYLLRGGKKNGFDSSDLFNDKNKVDEILKSIKYIQLEISPTCDFSQKKWKLNRLIPGILLPTKYSNKVKDKTEYIYKSNPDFLIGKEMYKLVFDFRYFTAKCFDELNGMKPKFRIRHELLVDIQSHLVRHINRPGVIFMKTEKINEKKKKN
ncbi:MAG TPA: hypothetical protein VK469_05470 [Candidatus Kapabacteria bacterium]|nr:hypothetical protein [Candidatus Kapabacteria bacterium]